MKRSRLSAAVGLGALTVVAITHQRVTLGFQLHRHAASWPSCRYLLMPSLSTLHATTVHHNLQDSDETTTHHQNENLTALAFRTTDEVNSIIGRLSKSKRKDAAQKADDLLTELWSHYIATDDQAYLPTRATYVSTISAWARSGLGRQAAERAEALLEEMEAHRAQHPAMGPNTASVNAVLNAWSKSSDRGAADRCERIIERMESLALQGREELRPDTVSFNTAIDTLARSGQRNGPRRAEEMLDRIRTPDVYTYNTVINSWARVSSLLRSFMDSRSRSSFLLYVL
jgi:hypothetical protein